MKHYYIGLLSLLFVGGLHAQETVKMSAVRSNNYGVVYSLPKTAITVKAQATKTTRKAGEFFEYAQQYLNIANPITQDEVIYTLTDISAEVSGVADKEKSYQVEFRSNTVAPFVTLDKNGLICAINADAQFDAPSTPNNTTKTEEAKPILNPNSFLSEETLRAGSKSRQAELIAKQIFLLRETRNSILTGEADNMPPDGNAYKLVMERLDTQEKALTSLFAGTETVENIEPLTSTIIPENKNIDKQVIFRFSRRLGFVRNDDLSGAPAYLSLISKEAVKEAPILSPKEEKELEKKFSKGIIFNVPGKATLKVEFGNKDWVNKSCDVVQYGIQDVLVPQMFDNNKQPIKVIFYPEMGAIKQIIQ
ncbi:DUF4831 family protein [Dysgonomonas macrotermitis]|uniref:DUF4831 domain-containing protein n=1 Tax=Dysgonomonas macrotermitis TaxID=1346286 RepID=A0A1M5FAX4_9BACT|nr:DUF4831 family protein [Dysgonomonas macrotermitis]SHF88589.1 protein of unknown function [Dysgonomonas macrotermitis]